MTAPPGLAPTQEAAAPERYREAGTRLTRKMRDAVARRFMAEFGMSGATAVRYALVVLNHEPAIDDGRLAGMSRADLARFIAEVPGGRKPRRSPRRQWAVTS